MEEQEIKSEDVGDVAQVLEEKAETPLEIMERNLTHVRNTKAWALVKANTLVSNIEKAGGEVPAAMQEKIEQLKAECASPE